MVSWIEYWFPNIHAMEFRNVTARSSAEIKNSQKNGSVPIPRRPSSSPPFDDELQLEKDESCFPNSFISPFCVTFKIASEMSMAKVEPFGNT